MKISLVNVVTILVIILGCCLNHPIIVQANNATEEDDGGNNSIMMDEGNNNKNETVYEDGEIICFNGYVMDHFCIGRGTLLDAPSRATLSNPDIHSIHCLVDIGACRANGYELLVDPTDGSSTHPRAFRLDDVGNQMVIDLARSVGSCGTCDSARGQSDGFRATVIGKRYNGPAPQLLEVLQMRYDDEPCTEEEGGQFVPFNVTTVEGFNGFGIDPITWHASMMIAAWGFFVPGAVLSSLFFRHQPNGIWFNVHRICNGLAIFLTFVGIVYAFAKFGNIFVDGAKPSQRHATLGMTTFSIAIVQVILGIFRPHLPSENDGESKSNQRIAFEFIHRGLGYTAVALAYTTMYFGAEVSGSNQDTFYGVWYALFGIAAAMAVWMLWNKYEYYRDHPERRGKNNDTNNNNNNNKNNNKAATNNNQKNNLEGVEQPMNDPENAKLELMDEE